METLWHGKLTEENLNDVANKILEMPHNKQYTFLVASKVNNYSPSIYRNLCLETENPLSFRNDGFTFSDSYGTWGCSTKDDVEIVLNNNVISIVIVVNNSPLYWTIYISD